MKIRTNNKTTQIICFYLLCSLISFGGAALFILDKGIPGDTTQIDTYFPQMLIILLAGPLFVLKPVATGFLLIIYYILLSGLFWTFVFIIHNNKPIKNDI